jgi:hypothetical protein
VEIITERPETEMEQSNGEQYGSGENAQTQQEQDTTQASAQQGFGFNQNQPGFGNMDFNANGMNGFNPMMAMQNGMMPGFAMGMPNMMGKHFRHQRSLNKKHMLTFPPGMNGMPMDPSMMMGNNNFGGMGGMNDMNVMASMMGAGGFGAGMPGMGMNQGFGMNGGGGYNRVGPFIPMLVASIVHMAVASVVVVVGMALAVVAAVASTSSVLAVASIKASRMACQMG